MRRLFFVVAVTVPLSAVFMLGVGTSDEQREQAPPVTLDGVAHFANAGNEAKLKAALRAFGVRAAMEQLVFESVGGSTVDCHQQAHFIGRIGYDVAGKDVFASCTSSCHSGCYHGAMESFLNEQGTVNLAANIDELCKIFVTTFGTFECFHGVGHGVLAYVNYDMPSAIAQCRELTGGFAEASCFGGMFMENILTGQGLGAGTAVHTTNWVNREDPYFPCNAIPQDTDLQRECYMMQTSWMLTMFNYNFDRVVDACLYAPKDMTPVCFQSLGRDIAGYTLRDPKRIVELCAKVPDQSGYGELCAVGALNVVVDFWGPDLGAQGSELCNALSDTRRERCYTVLATRLTDVFSDLSARERACATFEPAYQRLCAF